MKKAVWAIVILAVIAAGGYWYYASYMNQEQAPATAPVSETQTKPAPAETRPVSPGPAIKIVGSSTVFPFSIAVAEQFGQKTGYKTPVVESTGSGGGIKLFCAGAGRNTPDMVNSSRRMKESELESCIANGVTPTEVMIGYDGIVVANSKQGAEFQLTLEQLFLALAKEVPSGGKLVANPYVSWSDIDPSLPNLKIEVLGPPPTSGTRDAFVEIAMEGGCASVSGAKELGLAGKACHAIREDGAFVEAGENDNLIIQKIESNPDAIGIFGFSFLDQNSDKINGLAINGALPDFDAIAAGDYPISRSLYFYAKIEHSLRVPGFMEFIKEFTADGTWGDEGYLADKGLIPMTASERSRVRNDALILLPLQL